MDVADKSRLAPLLIAGAVARGVLGIVAVPLAPLLFKRHFLVLVLMRPTKEVLLAGGFLARGERIELYELALCALPLLIGGVWLFYALGRAYGERLIEHGIGRLLPAERMQKLSKVLERGGARLVFLGRLAAFPSTAIAAAAGSSGMRLRTFLLADGLGGLASIVLVVGAGFGFGQAYKSAGPWLTGVGVAGLLAILVVIGRLLKRT